MKKLFLASAVFTVAAFATYANITLPKIFSDHTVLQRNAPIKIWGWADCGEKISITLNNQKKSVTAEKDGKWSISLEAMPAGGPYTLTASGKNTITLQDILIGEVWLCSGQSNMAFSVQHSHTASTEIPAANFPMIRSFTVVRKTSDVPLADLDQTQHWVVCSPETVGNFTAVGYYFAKQLHLELNVPIGIINSSWGGTMIEPWISYSAITKHPDYESIPPLKEGTLGVWRTEMDKLYQHYASALGIKTLQGYKATDSMWHKVEYDDSHWIPVPFPGKFDNKLLPLWNGIVWFRTEIDVPEKTALADLTLNLGVIDEVDATFFNGVKVGGAETLSKRKYVVKSENIKPGKNSLIIKVLDRREDGGFFSPENEIYIEGSNGFKIALKDLSWKMNFPEVQLPSSQYPNVYPGILFNAMINPIIPFTLKGVIWYQGESNFEYGYQYREILPVLIKDWRTQWHQGEIPFYFVQLPNFHRVLYHVKEGGTNWIDLRESFYKTLLNTPNTGMAVTIDLGDSTDIHPTNKIDVGKRLSLIALNKLYQKPVVCEGPELDRVEFTAGKVLLTFKNTGSGLITKDRYGYVRGFQVAGEDQEFYYEKALIEGNTVIITCEHVRAPVAVRYAWAGNPDGNLYNNEGLPAMPFRTDHWKLFTEGAKYNNWIGNRYNSSPYYPDKKTNLLENK
jgi:sialate O-acetylesterase